MDCCSDEEGEVMADEGHEAEKLAAIHAAMMVCKLSVCLVYN